MCRNISPEVLEQIKEFNQKGFISSTQNALNILRKNPNMRIFRGSIQRSVGRGGGSNKYAIYDFFGKKNFQFLYDIERKEEFAKYLCSVFNTINPDASTSLICAFGHLLSSNYLKPKYKD